METVELIKLATGGGVSAVLLLFIWKLWDHYRSTRDACEKELKEMTNRYEALLERTVEALTNFESYVKTHHQN